MLLPYKQVQANKSTRRRHFENIQSRFYAKDMRVPQFCNVGRAAHRPSVHIVKKHVDRPVNGNFRPQRKTKHIGKRKPFNEKSSHETKLSYSFSDTADKNQPQEQSRQKRRGSCALARDHESSYQKFGGNYALSQDPENRHRNLAVAAS